MTVLTSALTIRRAHQRSLLSRGGTVHYFICDSEAELPSKYVFAGDLAYTADTDKFWLRTEEGWVEQGSDGGVHPDLSAHNTLGLATQSELDSVAAAKADVHSHPYSSTSHNHDGSYAAPHTHPYSADSHNHSGVYEPVHSHPYAASAHNHDAAYSLLSHTHGGGAGAWTTVIKTSDTDRVNNTLADDPNLIVTLNANTQYVIKIRVWMTTNATADAKCRLVFTGTTTRVRRRVIRTSTGDAATIQAIATAFDAADVILSTTGLNPYYEDYLVLQVGASGGQLKFQWAQVTTNASPCTVLEGSHIEYAVA